jgi:hypothetical protein
MMLFGYGSYIHFFSYIFDIKFHFCIPALLILRYKLLNKWWLFLMRLGHSEYFFKASTIQSLYMRNFLKFCRLPINRVSARFF